MGQPIRKNILEKKPELALKPFYTLLIDGNSLLRLSFKDDRKNSDGVHYGAIFQALLQIKIQLMKRPFDYVYCFFDGANSGYNRWELYPQYKLNRGKDYASCTFGKSDYMKEVDARIASMMAYFKSKSKKKEHVKTEQEQFVDENFARERDTLLEYFNELSIRWCFDDEDVSEGDDYIAYYVMHKKPEERIVIMTLDGDLGQLISDTVCVYDLRTKKYLSKENYKRLKGYPVENILVKKVFCGDVSDNIGNIKGLSESRLFELIPEMKERAVTIDEVKERAQKMIDERVKEKKKPLQWQTNIIEGISNKEYEGNFYEVNEKIVDLKHPMLSESAEEEISAMMYAPLDPEGRSFENLYSMIRRDNIEDLVVVNNFSNFFIPFKGLSDREKKRYNDFLEK